MSRAGTSNADVSTFQGLLFALGEFWSQRGCALLQPYDMEVGAGTFHPGTFLRAIGPEPWAAAHPQVSRRPSDGRYGENPNRLQRFYQYQVVMKPSPLDIQDIYLASLVHVGIDPLEHDIRFVEDNWESPTLGAWGLGWEVWLNGMEITQFTYFQQVGGLECRPVTAEIAYGIERIAMYLQGGGQHLRPRVDTGTGRHPALRRHLLAERARDVGLQLRACRYQRALLALRQLRRGVSEPLRGQPRNSLPTTWSSRLPIPSTCSMHATRFP